jgi:phospholipid/cholesterol/gamma-HCH transport system substrate-binding protein
VAVSLAVGVTILVQQRAAFPEWVPLIGDDRFQLEIELGTAQAVTPGQGQTVNIAGIDVGDVSEVRLEEGRAIVTARIEDGYPELLGSETTALLRPRTNLKDMTIELDTEGGAGEPLQSGDRIPLASTLPDINTDEFLAGLDGETQDYLRLLLQAGAEGLGGRGDVFSALLRRFEPTTRDIAKINGAVQKRRQNLARVIHNFRLVAEEVGRNDTQLARFIDSSNAVFAAFGNQDQNIQDTIRELPSTLVATREALVASDAFSTEAAPAFRALVPAAKQFKPALEGVQPLFEETRIPIRDQIRPFTKQVKPVVTELRRASEPLADTSVGLKGSFTELNRLLNALAYNPPGAAEEGHLFWAGWLAHNTNAAFNLQDGNGPVLRSMVLASCSTARLAEAVTSIRPFLQTAKDLSHLALSSDIC